MVAADRMEFSGFLRRLEAFERLHFPVSFSAAGTKAGQRFVMVANGPGPALARRAVEAAAKGLKIDKIVSIGFCGALDPTLRVGDVFVGRRIEAVDRKISYTLQLPSARRSSCSGSVVSIDRVAQTVEEKEVLRKSGASVVEMEASAVAEVAQSWGLPCYCVRVVTDRANEGFALDLNIMRDSNGRFDRKRIVASALRHPVSVLPELIRLRQRSRFAANLLGEFLADCRF